MQIQVNTSSHVDGREGLIRKIEETVTSSMKRFAAKLTRVEIHITDEDSDKKSKGDDIRCKLEARPRGLDPITVSNQAATVDQAYKGAIDKAERALERAFGKLADR